MAYDDCASQCPYFWLYNKIIRLINVEKWKSLTILGDQPHNIAGRERLLRTLHPLKVFALTRLPRGCASSRYRAYQYIEPLKKHGIDLVVKSTYPSWIYEMRKRSEPRSWLLDGLTVAISLFRDIAYLISAARADIVFIVRDAAPFSLTLLLRLLRKKGKPIIFDFDDAVYLKARHIRNYVNVANVVFAGNSELANWAGKANKSTIVIPTVIDVSRYHTQNCHKNSDSRFVIGWIGSPSTATFLEIVRPGLQKLGSIVPLELKLIGGSIPEIPGVNTKSIPWSEDTETDEIANFDVGISPLAEDEFTRGKCGVKALQYMAAGVPVVASPVGVHKNIIKHGANGFLASSENDWFQYLQLLVQDTNLRVAIGQSARESVEKYYSLDIMSRRIANEMWKLISR